MPRRALTLLEILAVVVIIGILAVSAGSLAAKLAGKPDLARESAALLMDGLRQLREDPGSGGVAVHLDAQGFAAQQANGLLRRSVGIDVLARWTSGGAPLNTLAIDQGGRSADVELEVTSRTTTYRFLISGLTGATIPLAAQP